MRAPAGAWWSFRPAYRATSRFTIDLARYHERVATWQDGPEYAPAERPDGFAAPVAAPLDTAPAVRRPDTILIEPVGYVEPDGVGDLAQVSPPSHERRDPSEPFAVVSSIVSDSSAWGSAHSHGGGTVAAWDPRQPLPTSAASAADFPPPDFPPPAFPAPGTPQWFGPGEAAAPQPPAVRPTVAAAARAAGIGLLITLFVGGLISVLSVVCLFTGWALSTLVVYRQKAVGRLFAGSACCAVLFALAWFVRDGWSGGLEVMGLVAQVLCWLCALITVFIQYAAIAAGERPDRRR